MNWSSSGILHTFAYQLVDGRNLSTSRGWLRRVVGGKLTESYRGENRMMLSLDVDGEDVPLGCAVRVWHDASNGGESVHECLGTFIPDPAGGTYRYGRVTGSVDLYSPIKRLSTMNSSAITGVGKVNVINHFKDVVSNAYSTPWVKPGWKTTATFSKAYTWLRTQESNLDEAQRCADALGGYIGVDVQGRVTLTPYVLPRKLPASWTLEDVTLDGVDIDEPEIVNRVVAWYEDNSGGKTRTYARMKELPASSPRYKGRIYRHETRTLNPSEIGGGDVNAQLDKLAQQELDAAQGGVVYSCTALYDSAVRAGTSGRLLYTDSPSGEPIDAKVFCSEREVNLGASPLTTLTLEAI